MRMRSTGSTNITRRSPMQPIPRELTRRSLKFQITKVKCLRYFLVFGFFGGLIDSSTMVPFHFDFFLLKLQVGAEPARQGGVVKFSFVCVNLVFYW